MVQTGHLGTFHTPLVVFVVDFTWTLTKIISSLLISFGHPSVSLATVSALESQRFEHFLLTSNHKCKAHRGQRPNHVFQQAIRNVHICFVSILISPDSIRQTQASARPRYVVPTNASLTTWPFIFLSFPVPPFLMPYHPPPFSPTSIILTFPSFLPSFLSSFFTFWLPSGPSYSLDWKPSPLILNRTGLQLDHISIVIINPHRKCSSNALHRHLGRIWQKYCNI